MRAVGLNLGLGAAAIAVTGGAAPTASQQFDSVYSANEAEIGVAYALDDARIEASATTTWDFPVLSVTVVPEPVVVLARVFTGGRAAANNPAPASVGGNAVLEFAATLVGTPYVRGGTSTAGFDCTGFVSYVYSQFGVSLPRTSASYWNIGTRVSAADAQPGDLIVSNGHVAIYAGDGMQIDSPRPGKTIQFRGIWQKSFIFVRVS